MRLRDILIYALMGSLALPAQQAQQLVQTPKPEPLTLTVLEGEGGKNNIRTRSAVAPVVEVKDASGKPVSGAEVVFQLPLAGPGGAFNGWLRTQTVRTDEAGKASVTGYTPNTEPGRFNIKVTATSGAASGQVIIAQVNIENGTGAETAAAGKTGGKMPSGIKKSIPWKLIGPVIGAAAIGGVAAAVRGGNGNGSTTAPVPVSISAGAVGVGVPR